MDLRKGLIMLLCLGCAFTAGAQPRKLLSFEPRIQELDTMRFDADSILVTYIGRNISGHPISILDVHSSCGCFTGSAPKKVIPAGGTVKVQGWFKPHSLHGEQKRYLTLVTASAGADSSIIAHTVGVHAYVLRDQSEGEIRFPLELGEGLRTDKGTYMLALDSYGDYSLRFPLYNDTDAPMSVEFIGPRRLKLFAPSVIAPRSREDVRGIYNARWIRRGREVHEKLQIKVNGTEVLPIEITRKF